MVERLYRPAATVTTATRTHVLLEEHPDDTAARAAAAGLVPSESPSLPTTARVALDPAAVPSFLAEVGRNGRGAAATGAAGTDTAGTGGTGGTGADGVLTVVSQDQLGLCHLDGPAAAIRHAREVAERLGGRLLALDPALGLPAFGPGHAPGPLSRRVAAALGRPVPLTLAYQAPCHLRNVQGLADQVRALVAAIPGLTLMEPDDEQRCCGSGDIYSMEQPDFGDALLASKHAALQRTGAQGVVSGNPGCAMQIARTGWQVHHPAQLLARSLRP